MTFPSWMGVIGLTFAFLSAGAQIGAFLISRLRRAEDEKDQPYSGGIGLDTVSDILANRKRYRQEAWEAAYTNLSNVFLLGSLGAVSLNGSRLSSSLEVISAFAGACLAVAIAIPIVKVICAVGGSSESDRQAVEALLLVKTMRGLKDSSVRHRPTVACWLDNLVNDLARRALALIVRARPFDPSRDPFPPDKDIAKLEALRRGAKEEGGEVSRGEALKGPLPDYLYHVGACVRTWQYHSRWPRSWRQWHKEMDKTWTLAKKNGVSDQVRAGLEELLRDPIMVDAVSSTLNLPTSLTEQQTLRFLWHLGNRWR